MIHIANLSYFRRFSASGSQNDLPYFLIYVLDMYIFFSDKYYGVSRYLYDRMVHKIITRMLFETTTRNQIVVLVTHFFSYFG